MRSHGAQPCEGGRVLLVEDDHANRRMMSDYLIYCGYDVVAIALGAMFFETLHAFQPNVVLMDLKLPDISGYTLLEQLQTNSDGSKIPVIVVSAFAFQSDQQRALQLGACEYLIKPLNLMRLRQSIQREIHRVHSAS